MAIIAKPHANEHVICQYPCDGDTDGRHYNCHVQGCPCHASGNGDWCTHSLHGLGPHKPCAFKPSETSKMMKAFKDVSKGSSPLLKGYVSPWTKGQEPSACGYYHAIGLGHNEVVIDARTWDKHIKDNIWAIVKTDKCTGACETQLKALQKDHTSKYGHLPLLHFNRHDSPLNLLTHFGGQTIPPRWNHSYRFALFLGKKWYPLSNFMKVYKLSTEQFHISRLGDVVFGPVVERGSFILAVLSVSI